MKGGKEAFWLCTLFLLAASTIVGGSEEETSLPATESAPSPAPSVESQPTHQAKARKPRSPTFIIEEIISNHSHIRSELKGINPVLSQATYYPSGRGWTEQRRRGIFEPSVDFKWSWSYERLKLTREEQYGNHFSNSDQIGTKIGLSTNLRRWKIQQHSHNGYAPVCYLRFVLNSQ